MVPYVYRGAATVPLDSTGQRNSGRVDRRGVEAEALAGTGVEFVGDVVEIFLGWPSHAFAHGEVLTQEAIGVFVRAPLPRTAWVGEEDLEQRSTFANSFVGLWLPWDVEATLTITSEKGQGSVDISTVADAPTCLTTLN